MARGGLALALALVCGCYRPSGEPACSVVCDHLAQSPVCPDGLTCGTDNRCFETTQCNQIAGDAPIGNGDADGCIGNGFLHLCPQPPSGDRTIGNGTYTTEAPNDCTEVIPYLGGELCVITGVNLVVDGFARWEGTRPVVLVAIDKISVHATSALDVSELGAGARFGGCPLAGDGVNGNAPTDALGGGAGGTLATTGGLGGPRDGSTAGAPAAQGAVPTRFRGGCDGGRGGIVIGSGAGGGNPGGGGGAIYLLAGSTIT